MTAKYGTYYGLLDSIRGDPVSIERERNRLQQIVSRVSTKLIELVTAATAPGLIWSLNVQELARVSKLVDIDVSDFMGHARHLRALCAKTKFTTGEANSDPKSDGLLLLCDKLWAAMFHLEMIALFSDQAGSDLERRRRSIAGMMSLLGAVQGELLYPEQAYARCRRLYSQFSKEIISPQLGITVEEAISGIEYVRHSVALRVEESKTLAEEMRELHEGYCALLEKGATKPQLDKFVYGHPRYESAAESFQRSQRIMQTLFFFTSTQLDQATNGNGEAFLRSFSFIPGKDNLDYQTPYDADIVRSHPFARLSDGTYLLVDACYCKMAPLYRLEQCFSTPRQVERLRKRRDTGLEEETRRLFTQTFVNALLVTSYYVPVAGNSKFAERDLLIIHGDSAFIVECKAAPLRPLGARGDKTIRIASDVKKTIVEGYQQATSVIEYLKSCEGECELFDESGIVAQKLDLSGVTSFFPIIVLDGYFGLVAADLACWFEPLPGIGFPWVVDSDTLESIFLKINTPFKFREFLKWRSTVHGKAVNEDEAVFAGYYHQHGAIPIPFEGGGIAQLSASYADVFEIEYFRRQGIEIDIPEEKQTPPVWSTITRNGDQIEFRIGDELYDTVNIKTGSSRSDSIVKAEESDRFRRIDKRPLRIGRNQISPCGSGRKFKYCCLRRGS
jgi:hypothetical protein